MRAFIVRKGTKVKAIPVGKDWHGSNFRDHTTKAEHMFFTEDMRIDPLGHIGPPLNGVTVGSAWAKAGWYGFEKHGWIFLVPRGKVEVY